MTWQPAALEHPDIELLVTGFLRGSLPNYGHEDVFVSRSVPETRRPSMVICRREGGGTDDFLDRPRLRVTVWSATDREANALAAKVAAIMPLVATGQITRAVKVAGPYEIPDESGQPCRYLAFELITRPTQT